MNEFLKYLTDEIEHYKSISKTPFGEGYLCALENAKRRYEQEFAVVPTPWISNLRPQASHIFPLFPTVVSEKDYKIDIYGNV